MKGRFENAEFEFPGIIAYVYKQKKSAVNPFKKSEKLKLKTYN